MVKKTFSIRIDTKLIEKIEVIAQQQRWSRNQTIAYLIELGLIEVNNHQKENVYGLPRGLTER